MEAPSHRAIPWEVYPELPNAEFRKAWAAGIAPLHLQLLHNRGIKSLKEVKAFINARYEETPDPYSLIDMHRAVERIQKALENREHITVYGDYDADGITSSSLLFCVLRSLKYPEASLDYHIPHRLNDGCGLNLLALDKLKAGGTQLIITTDCASSDVEQVAYAKSLGIDIIITDHHHPPAELPQAYAMINPWRPDCTYGERFLCGVGIAFKLSQALYRKYGRSTEEEMELLDLVAVGTIADVALLLGENHTLVRLGLQRLNTTRKPGLKALIRSANLRPGRIRERDIAFGLAPRINAAGRMEHASIAFELLITDNEEEATLRAEKLEQLNIKRQQETEELMRNVREQAQLQPQKAIVLVNGDNWHEGIIGLVAGKLAEEIQKPVLVLSNDKKTQLSRGSARSQKGFNMIRALRGFADRLERYGGHSQAAGFTIRSEHIEELHKHLLEWKEDDEAVVAASIDNTIPSDQTTAMAEQQSTESHSSPYMVDLVFTRLELLNYGQYTKMRVLSPFGAGNPEPIFKMEGLRLIQAWSSGINKQNLRLRLESRNARNEAIQQIGTLIRGAGKQQELKDVERVNVIFKLEASDDESKQEIWLKILDVEPATR